MKHLLLAAVALAFAAPAYAVGVTTIAVTDGSTASVAAATPGILQIDFGINSTAPIGIGLITEAGDANGIAFDSIVDSFLGTVNAGGTLRRLTLSLDGGATFGTIGSVTPAFSTASGILNGTATSYEISFAGGEGFGLELGDTGNGGSDFVIDVAGLSPGSAFSLTLSAVAVPEPSSWALMLGGFGLIGGAMRTRARRSALGAG